MFFVNAAKRRIYRRIPTWHAISLANYRRVPARHAVYPAYLSLRSILMLNASRRLSSKIIIEFLLNR